MKIDNYIVLVPESLPYSEFTAYLLTVMSNYVFGYALITFLSIMLLLSVFRYIKHKKVVFVQGVADVVNLLMNDNSYIQYNQLSRAEMFLIVPLTFAGFIITNGMLSALTSYVTRLVFQPQIN